MVPLLVINYRLLTMGFLGGIKWTCLFASGGRGAAFAFLKVPYKRLPGNIVDKTLVKSWIHFFKFSDGYFCMIDVQILNLKK